MSEYRGPGTVQPSRSGKSEFVEFRGVRFYRYPNSKVWSHRHYFQPHHDRRAEGISQLHVEIWKSVYGPLPPNSQVHHRDEDTFNCEIGNLECVPRLWHLKHHAQHRDKRTPANLEHLARIRPLAAEWHGSPEGIEWHRENGKRVMANRKPKSFICEWCGKPFQSIQTRARFCHVNCKNRYNYHNSPAPSFQSRRRK